MPSYDSQVLRYLGGLFRLAGSRVFWFPALLTLIPTAALYWLGVGFAFSLYVIGICLYARSARLGGLLGWLIVTENILLYYYFPEAGHFIEYLLRAPGRAGGAVRAADAGLIPETFSARLFLGLVYGARGGLLIGCGLGVLARKLWGRRDGIEDLSD